MGVGPLAYETGKPLAEHGGIALLELSEFAEMHTDAGPMCHVALWNVLKKLPGQTAMQEPWKTGMPRLRELLLWMRQLEPEPQKFL